MQYSYPNPYPKYSSADKEIKDLPDFDYMFTSHFYYDGSIRYLVTASSEQEAIDLISGFHNLINVEGTEHEFMLKAFTHFIPKNYESKPAPFKGQTLITPGTLPNNLLLISRASLDTKAKLMKAWWDSAGGEWGGTTVLLGGGVTLIAKEDYFYKELNDITEVKGNYDFLAEVRDVYGNYIANLELVHSYVNKNVIKVILMGVEDLDVGYYYADVAMKHDGVTSRTEVISIEITENGSAKIQSIPEVVDGIDSTFDPAKHGI